MSVVTQSLEQWFEQMRAAETAMREKHEELICCGARWDGMDGYECTRTVCSCFAAQKGKSK